MHLLLSEDWRPNWGAVCCDFDLVLTLHCFSSLNICFISFLCEMSTPHARVAGIDLPSPSPLLKILITPQFNDNEEAIGLYISLTICTSPLEKDSTVICFSPFLNIVPNINDVRMSDEIGELPILAGSESSSQRWLAGRKTSGDIHITYRVSPSSSDEFRSGGPIVGLHTDQGGLLGSGFTMFPVIALADDYEHIVKWDLRNAPHGTRAIPTYGEGVQALGAAGSATMLQRSVYMVGLIRSDPSVPEAGTMSDWYGFYWFGELPKNISVIRDMHYDFFLRVAEFFGDTPSSSYCHRSFIRNTGSQKSFGGISFGQSHIFNYDNQINKAEDYDLVRRMSYEMSDIWLGPAPGQDIDWLYEGIKNCLSVYMPFRNKFRTGDYFQATINMLLMRYYTSPLINLPHEELLKLVLTNQYARELLGARAWVFVVGMDIKARSMSDLTRPIEDLGMKPLAIKKAAGDPHGIDVWMNLLRPLMGEEISQRYEHFLSGSTILLNTQPFFGAETHHLKQVDMEILDFGLDRESFADERVRGLKKGSRAEESDLREGDKIIQSSYEWRCIDHLEEVMDVVVEREGVEVEIRYWPRTFEKTKSWQFVTKEEEAD